MSHYAIYKKQPTKRQVESALRKLAKRDKFLINKFDKGAGKLPVSTDLVQYYESIAKANQRRTWQVMLTPGPMNEVHPLMENPCAFVYITAVKVKKTRNDQVDADGVIIALPGVIKKITKLKGIP